MIPQGLTAAALATDAAVRNKTYGSGMTTLIISNKEIKNIMKIVKSLEESGLLPEGASETIENETKEHKGGLLSVLLGALAASLTENMLAAKAKIISDKSR